MVSPQDLMNRWIVPLDRRRDYLTLHTGYKFEIPFDVIVVFSSNDDPSRLADEAFLRRIGYKIHIGTLNEDQYRNLFCNVCDELSIPFSEVTFQYLLQEYHYKEQRSLLACYPRDLLGQVRDLACMKANRPNLPVPRWTGRGTTTSHPVSRIPAARRSSHASNPKNAVRNTTSD